MNNIMESLGDVYILSVSSDNVLVMYRHIENYTIGQAYNDMVKLHGAPLKNEYDNEVIRLIFDNGKTFILSVLNVKN